MRREAGGVAGCIYIVYTLHDMYMYIYESVRVDLELYLSKDTGQARNTPRCSAHTVSNLEHGY